MGRVGLKSFEKSSSQLESTFRHCKNTWLSKTPVNSINFWLENSHTTFDVAFNSYQRCKNTAVYRSLKKLLENGYTKIKNKSITTECP